MSLLYCMGILVSESVSYSFLSHAVVIDSLQQTVRNVMPPRETFVLEDLYPNTIYNIRITARSIQGEGPHTNTIQVKTNEAGMNIFDTLPF